MKELGVKEAIEYLRRHFDDRFFDGRFDARSAQKKSIEALEKQIPKKPIARDLWELGTAQGSSCPNCWYDFPIGNYKRYKYCPDCGHALDWSDKNV